MERYPGDDVVDLVSFDSYQYGDPQKDNSFVIGLDTKLRYLKSCKRKKQNSGIGRNRV